MPVEHNRSREWQRCEAKYLVSEAQAAVIRRYCRDHLPPDPHSSPDLGCDYPILSVYLDSPCRQLLQQALVHQTSRYKLRVRTYRRCDEVAADRPAYFEIKRKVNGIVQKTRAQIEPPMADVVLWTAPTLFDLSDSRDADAQINLNAFQQLRSRIRAGPALGVFYRREAYEGISADRVRITLDHDLRYGLLAPPGSADRDMWWPVDPGGLILEVKFTKTYPCWVSDMLHRVEVGRRGVCKYVTCSRAAGCCGLSPTLGQCFR